MYLIRLECSPSVVGVIGVTVQVSEVRPGPWPQLQHQRTITLAVHFHNRNAPDATIKQLCTKNLHLTQTFFIGSYHTSQRSQCPCSSPLTHIRTLYYCVINGIITNLRHRTRRPFAAEKILVKYFSKAHRRAADLSKMYKIR